MRGGGVDRETHRDREIVVTFTQVIEVTGADEEKLREMVLQWDEDQSGVAPGYLGARVLADESNGHHLIEVDFSSEDEARGNNDRPATQKWAEQLQQVVDGQPTYRDLREVSTTYGSG